MSNSSAVVSVMLNAISSMATVSLVSLVAVLCALYPKDDPLISPTFLRQVARLSSMVFLPALMIYVLGSGLSLKIISQLFILLPFAFVISIVSFIIAHTVGKLIIPEDTPLRSGLIVCCCMPNATSLPIMILQSACKQPAVNEDYDSDQNECETAALSMLFVYGIGWNIMFWAFARYELERCSKQMPIDLSSKLTMRGKGLMAANSPAAVSDPLDDGDELKVVSDSEAESVAGSEAGRLSLREKFEAFFLSPPMLGIYIGILIGICAPLQSLLFFEPFSPLAPLGDSLKTVSEPLICVSTFVMAASLAQVRIDIRALSVYRFCIDLYYKLLPEPGVDAEAKSRTQIEILSLHSVNGNADAGVGSNADASFCGTVPPYTNGGNGYGEGDSGFGHGVQSITYLGTDVELVDSVARSRSRSRSVSREDDIMMDEVASVISADGTITAVSELPPWNYFVFHTICRLILPPIIILPLLQGAISVGIIGRSQRLLALVVVIESCVPSAQLILIVLNQYGLQEMATNISLMYLFHYMISIFTITFWFSVGMLMIY